MSEFKILPSVVISIGLHILVAATGGLTFIQPAQFAVDPGIAGVEVQLRSVEKRSESDISFYLYSENAMDLIEPTKTISKPLHKTEAKEDNLEKDADDGAVASKGGAITQAKPDYLSNPAPSYPHESRRLGQEGLVILGVDVDRQGKAGWIEIIQSSGYPKLDHAAVKAVRRWIFAPARVGSIPVDSKVRVPIRFSLQK